MSPDSLERALKAVEILQRYFEHFEVVSEELRSKIVRLFTGSAST